ncbi:phage baseplate assembly protein V [Campylobacter lanienae]|uniref:phage baseplate assembly protein V n=1 Tax=Campylobacter lanienae TaxID=75658 RepID=UPI000BB42966|nr:phage baseplate assembly protein V [Campylobacter lanienae]
MIEIGIIAEVRGDKVRVAIADMITDFLPVVFTGQNSFKTSWEPLRVGEQCIVLPIRGELNAGVVIRGISTLKYPTPSSDENIQITEFSDGVIISYDVSSHTLNIASPKSINISCDDISVLCQNATIEATKVSVNATTTSIESPSINLNGNTTIAGNISTSSSQGGAGSVVMNGTLSLTGDLIVSGNIRDAKGDLTNHSHNDTDGYVSLPRS